VVVVLFLLFDVLLPVFMFVILFSHLHSVSGRYHKSQAIYLESKDNQKLSCVISSVGANEVGTKDPHADESKMCSMGWVPVAHTYNPSCLAGRDQEPAWANSSRDPILKNPSQK
jgi:hypothetical protein